MAVQETMLMWDRYDPRSDDGRDRGDSWDRSFGSRGSASERDHNEHSRDAVTGDLLGHASILTTERYDNQRLEALQAAVERLEGGKTFDPKIDASDKVSRIFQDPTEQSFARSEDPAKESATSH